MASSHMKRHSIILVMRNRKIKIIMTHYHIPSRMHEVRDIDHTMCWQGCESTGNHGETIKWCNHFGKSFGGSLKKLRIHLHTSPSHKHS